jgi:ferric-dicitrate binding protein FerR (iron transport regulator)
MAIQAREILEKIRNGTLTEEERILVESWYVQMPRGQTFDEAPEAFVDALEEIRAGIRTEEPGLRQRKLQSWYYAAAALILVGTFYVLFRPAPQRKTHLAQATEKQDFDPGTDKATLTLSDGRTMELGTELKPAKIDEEAQLLILQKPGQLIYKSRQYKLSSSESAYNQIKTPKGGQYKLVLSDGTQVWLNAASSLRFPLRFDSRKREVELSGEAYFEVSKTHVPFFVRTSSQEIKVLGTHFDVNSYTDETSTKTTLLEGSVQVRPLQANNGKPISGKMLRPGQQSRLAAGSLTIRPVDVAEETAWKNGSISFVNADIQSIMRQVSRWYNVDVVYSGEMPVRLFTGSISRNAKLSELLTILKLSKINFSIKGRQLTVSP